MTVIKQNSLFSVLSDYSQSFNLMCYKLICFVSIPALQNSSSVHVFLTDSYKVNPAIHWLLVHFFYPLKVWFDFVLIFATDPLVLTIANFDNGSFKYHQNHLVHHLYLMDVLSQATEEIRRANTTWIQNVSKPLTINRNSPLPCIANKCL